MIDRRSFPQAIALFVSICAACPAAGAPAVERPFMLWNKRDIARLNKAYATEPWVKQSLSRLEQSRGKPVARLFYAGVLGEEDAIAQEKKTLLDVVHSPAPQGAAQWLTVLRYDLLYHELTPEERRECEQCFRKYIDDHVFRRIIFDDAKWNNRGDYRRYDAREYTRTNWLPNIIWPWKVSANLMAVALMDEALIRKTWSAYGSWQWYFDEYLCDEGFYSEEFSKMTSTPGAMILYCEGLEALGLNELGYGYVGAGGATMRGHLESVIHLGYPRVDLGTSQPHYPSVTLGDLRHRQHFSTGHSVQGYFVQDAIVKGHGPAEATREDLAGGDMRWWTAGAWGGEKRTNRQGLTGPWDMGKTPKMGIPLWFELGHARWPEAGFGYFLTQMRAPDQPRYIPSLLFGLEPLDPKDTPPPPAPSAVWPERGLIMLRAEESPAYWESPAPAVCMRTASNYAHNVHDSFTLAGFYAFHRPIYLNRQTCSSYATGHSRSVASHAGVQVDDREPGFTYETVVRSHFSPLVKFAAARSEAVYEGVELSRSLMLTREYLLDVVSLKSDAPHEYRWRVHALGSAAVPRKIRSDGAPWAVTVEQICPVEDPDSTLLGRGWYDRQIGVRLTMLGDGKTAVDATDTPRLETKPGAAPPRDEIGGTTITVTRKQPSATFIAVHEPFKNGQPQIAEIRRIGETKDGVIAVAVIGQPGSGINDRLLIRLGDDHEQNTVVSGDGERFTFSGHAFVRIGAETVEARGFLLDIQARVPKDANSRLILNGKPVKANVANGVMVFEP